MLEQAQVKVWGLVLKSNLLPHCSSCVVYPSQSPFYLIIKTNRWLPAIIITRAGPVATSGSGCQAVGSSWGKPAWRSQISDMQVWNNSKNKHGPLQSNAVPLKQVCKKKRKKKDKDCFIRTVIFISVFSVHKQTEKSRTSRSADVAVST